MKKLILFFSLFCFLFSSFLAPYAQCSFWQERRSSIEQSQKLSLEFFPSLNSFSDFSTQQNNSFFPLQNLSPSVASVVDFKNTPSSNLTVIHIQDVHGNFSAQKNAAEILSYISRRNKTTIPVFIEGSYKKVFPEWMQIFPNEKIKKFVAWQLLKNNKITGEEYFLMQSSEENSIELFGLENEDIYLANLQTRYLLNPYREQILNQLRTWKKNLILKKNENKSYQVYRLSRQRYQEQDITLKEYVQILNKIVPINLEDKNYEQIALLLDLIYKENLISDDQLQTQKNKIIKDLSSLLDSPGLSQLTRLTLDYRSGSISSLSYNTMLLSLAQYYNLPCEILYRHVELLKLSKKINSSLLYQELTHYEQFVSAWTVNKENLEDIKFREIDRLLELETKFWSEKFTPKDWQDYQQNKRILTQLKKPLAWKQISEFLNQPETLNLSSLKTLEDLRSLQETYYALAKARDAVMSKNFLEQIHKIKKSKLKTVVLIAGGFHSDALMQALNNENISWVMIRPNLTSDLTAPILDQKTISWEKSKKNYIKIIEQKLQESRREKNKDLIKFLKKIKKYVKEFSADQLVLDPDGKRYRLNYQEDKKNFQIIFHLKEKNHRSMVKENEKLYALRQPLLANQLDKANIVAALVMASSVLGNKEFDVSIIEANSEEENFRRGLGLSYSSVLSPVYQHFSVTSRQVHLLLNVFMASFLETIIFYVVPVIFGKDLSLVSVLVTAVASFVLAHWIVELIVPSSRKKLKQKGFKKLIDYLLHLFWGFVFFTPFLVLDSVVIACVVSFSVHLLKNFFVWHRENKKLKVLKSKEKNRLSNSPSPDLSQAQTLISQNSRAGLSITNAETTSVSLANHDSKSLFKPIDSKSKKNSYRSYSNQVEYGINIEPKLIQQRNWLEKKDAKKIGLNIAMFFKYTSTALLKAIAISLLLSLLFYWTASDSIPIWIQENILSAFGVNTSEFPYIFDHFLPLFIMGNLIIFPFSFGMGMLYLNRYIKHQKNIKTDINEMSLIEIEQALYHSYIFLKGRNADSNITKNLAKKIVQYRDTMGIFQFHSWQQLSEYFRIFLSEDEAILLENAVHSKKIIIRYKSHEDPNNFPEINKNKTNGTLLQQFKNANSSEDILSINSDHGSIILIAESIQKQLISPQDIKEYIQDIDEMPDSILLERILGFVHYKSKESFKQFVKNLESKENKREKLLEYIKNMPLSSHSIALTYLIEGNFTTYDEFFKKVQVLDKEPGFKTIVKNKGQRSIEKTDYIYYPQSLQELVESLLYDLLLKQFNEWSSGFTWDFEQWEKDFNKDRAKNKVFEAAFRQARSDFFIHPARLFFKENNQLELNLAWHHPDEKKTFTELLEYYVKELNFKKDSHSEPLSDSSLDQREDNESNVSTSYVEKFYYKYLFSLFLNWKFWGIKETWKKWIVKFSWALSITSLVLIYVYIKSFILAVPVAVLLVILPPIILGKSDHKGRFLAMAVLFGLYWGAVFLSGVFVGVQDLIDGVLKDDSSLRVKALMRFLAASFVSILVPVSVLYTVWRITGHFSAMRVWKHESWSKIERSISYTTLEQIFLWLGTVVLGYVFYYAVFDKNVSIVWLLILSFIIIGIIDLVWQKLIWKRNSITIKGYENFYKKWYQELLGAESRRALLPNGETLKQYLERFFFELNREQTPDSKKEKLLSDQETIQWLMFLGWTQKDAAEALGVKSSSFLNLKGVATKPKNESASLRIYHVFSSLSKKKGSIQDFLRLPARGIQLTNYKTQDYKSYHKKSYDRSFVEMHLYLSSQMGDYKYHKQARKLSIKYGSLIEAYSVDESVLSDDGYSEFVKKYKHYQRLAKSRLVVINEKKSMKGEDSKDWKLMIALLPKLRSVYQGQMSPLTGQDVWNLLIPTYQNNQPEIYVMNPSIVFTDIPETSEDHYVMAVEHRPGPILNSLNYSPDHGSKNRFSGGTTYYDRGFINARVIKKQDGGAPEFLRAAVDYEKKEKSQNADMLKDSPMSLSVPWIVWGWNPGKYDRTDSKTGQEDPNWRLNIEAVTHNHTVLKSLYDKKSRSFYYSNKISYNTKLTQLFMLFHYIRSPLIVISTAILPVMGVLNPSLFITNPIFFSVLWGLMMFLISFNVMSPIREKGSFIMGLWLGLRGFIESFFFYRLLVPYNWYVLNKTWQELETAQIITTEAKNRRLSTMPEAKKFSTKSYGWTVAFFLSVFIFVHFSVFVYLYGLSAIKEKIISFITPHIVTFFVYNFVVIGWISGKKTDIDSNHKLNLIVFFFKSLFFYLFLPLIGTVLFFYYSYKKISSNPYTSLKIFVFLVPFGFLIAASILWIDLHDFWEVLIVLLGSIFLPILFFCLRVRGNKKISQINSNHHGREKNNTKIKKSSDDDFGFGDLELSPIESKKQSVKIISSQSDSIVDDLQENDFGFREEEIHTSFSIQGFMFLTEQLQDQVVSLSIEEKKDKQKLEEIKKQIDSLSESIEEASTGFKPILDTQNYELFLKKINDIKTKFEEKVRVFNSVGNFDISLHDKTEKDVSGFPSSNFELILTDPYSLKVQVYIRDLENFGKLGSAFARLEGETLIVNVAAQSLTPNQIQEIKNDLTVLFARHTFLELIEIIAAQKKVWKLQGGASITEVTENKILHEILEALMATSNDDAFSRLDFSQKTIDSFIQCLSLSYDNVAANEDSLVLIFHYLSHLLSPTDQILTKKSPLKIIFEMLNFWFSLPLNLQMSNYRILVITTVIIEQWFDIKPTVNDTWQQRFNFVKQVAVKYLKEVPKDKQEWVFDCSDIEYFGLYQRVLQQVPENSNIQMVFVGKHAVDFAHKYAASSIVFRDVYAFDNYIKSNPKILRLLYSSNLSLFKSLEFNLIINFDKELTLAGPEAIWFWELCQKGGIQVKLSSDGSLTFPSAIKNSVLSQTQSVLQVARLVAISQ